MAGSVIVQAAASGFIAIGVGATGAASHHLMALAANAAGARGSRAGLTAGRIASVVIPGLIVGKFLYSATANTNPVSCAIGLIVGFGFGHVFSSILRGSVAFAYPELEGRLIAPFPH